MLDATPCITGPVDAEGLHCSRGRGPVHYICYNIGVIGFKIGFYWDNGKENGNYRL